MANDQAAERPKKELIHFKQLLERILELQNKYARQVVIKAEDNNGKEYTSYTFEFDFTVDKFSSFIVMYWDPYEFDEVKLIGEIDEIDLKAERLRDA